MKWPIGLALFAFTMPYGARHGWAGPIVALNRLPTDKRKGYGIMAKLAA
ncbi:hypothetical protein [Burkholderia ubonensis]|nr:hypothetical protein [Burkholderia ubonensis]